MEALVATRILERARHRAKRRLMQDEAATRDRLAADLGIADVALDEAEARGLIRRHAGRELFEVAAMSGGEIVEADDLLVERQQRLDKVRADESGGACHQPAPRRGPQLVRSCS